ncbi:glycosyltransferase, partial [Vibrio alginolyticus]|uniref:glycosyltransferase n=1 Tax=Vibrio alginolyticus TaxID=663 RepID=UPI00354E649F
RARYSSFAIYKYFRSFELDTLLVFNHQLLMISIVSKILMNANFKIYSRGINTLSKELTSNKSFLNGKFLKFLITILYPRVNGVICQSQGMKEDLLTLIPKIEGKLVTINNPINDKYKNISVQTVDDANYILFVGRIEKQKNLSEAVDIFSRVVKRLPGLEFYIVGTGSEEAGLKQYVNDKDLTDQVRFIGSINDASKLASLYSNAKVTLLTSLFEGFPNVLVESISFGTPVVAYDCMSGPRDIIVDKVNGYLIELNNNRDFQKKLIQTIETDWNKVNIERTISHLDSKEVSKKYLDYMDLL